MRLRIVHQLSLLLMLVVALAVAAVGGVAIWNLRTGFSDYLISRDVEHLERFTALVAEQARADSSMEWLRARHLAMRSLVEEFHRREGLPPPPEGQPPPRGGPRPRAGPPPHDRPPHDRPPHDRPPHDRPPHDRPPDDGPPARDRPGRPPGPLGEPNGPPGPRGAVLSVGYASSRISVFDADGAWLAGHNRNPMEPGIERSVEIDGRRVARVRMAFSNVPSEVDEHFLRRQYRGLAAAAAVTLLLSLLLAGAIARRWSRPLREIQLAARRMASGELDTRVSESGAREVAQLIGDLNRMAESLKTLERARRTWIAQISHELRTPLSVLRGELESIQDGARVADATVIHNLHEEVLQLIRLVRDLHTVSVAELGRLPCEFRDGDAALLITRVAERQKPRLEAAGLSLSWQGTPSLQVSWDFGRIEQLLVNLLENCLRYTDSPGEVRLAWRRVGNQVEVRVEDSPPGIPPAQRSQIFDPLFRSDRVHQRRPVIGNYGSGFSNSSDSSGSGLGLAVARAIVLAHGGRIEALDSPLGGVAMHISLPVNAEDTVRSPGAA